VRVIFLDFDGVVHPQEDPDAAGRMRWIPILVHLLAPAPDVSIIVHSTWRYQYTDGELKELLGELGNRFIGSAPRMPREQAIETVLQANKSGITSHLVLDDDRKEFTSGRLNLVLCESSQGLSALDVQASIQHWLARTSPHGSARSGHRVPKGFGDLVLFLDFDGVLHREQVLWHPKRGAYAAPPGFQLFEHAGLLARLLEPYPTVRIVLSTAWVRRYGCYRTTKLLPAGLRERVIGATHHSQMNQAEFIEKPRGQQVWEDVLRRRPRDWFALDDDPEGWELELRNHVVLTDERYGISSPETIAALTAHLERLHGRG
jgi:hypothetical protein